jgi:hypothetical protein
LRYGNAASNCDVYERENGFDLLHVVVYRQPQ